MKIPQISVFIQNETGHLRDCIRRLSEAKVNLCALSLADTKHFGILRLITCECEKAKEILESSGYVTKTSDVLAVEIDNTPGSLLSILDLEADTGVNIEYMYAFANNHESSAVMVFCFDNIDRAITILEGKGHRLIHKDSPFLKEGKC